MDRLKLKSIRAAGHHGAIEGEKDRAQPFEVDVDLELDVAPAAAADDLELTVDYAMVAEEVARIVAFESHDLVETLAERIAAAALEHEGVAAVVVEVRKLQPAMDTDVAYAAVRVRRER